MHDYCHQNTSDLDEEGTMNPLSRLKQEHLIAYRIKTNSYWASLRSLGLSPLGILEGDPGEHVTMEQGLRDIKDWSAKRGISNIEESAILRNILSFPIKEAIKRKLGESALAPIADLCRTEYVRWRSFYGCWSHGSQIFRFEKALVEKLILTDVPEIPWSEFQLPFPGLILQVPTGFFQIEDPNTGAHDVDVFLINELHHEGKRGIALFILAGENAKSTYFGDDAVFYCALRESETLRTSTRVLFNANHDLINVNPRFRTLISFPLLALLYINSVPHDVIRAEMPEKQRRLIDKSKKLTGKKKTHVLNQLKEFTKLPMVVGTKVTIAHAKLGETAVQHARGNVEVSVASYVRGHWTHQPYGPKQSLRRLQWIEPYWRNLGATPTQKTYEVSL